METVFKAKIRLKVPPVSVNSATWGRNRTYTNETRAWRAKFFTDLMKDSNQSAVNNIRSYFDPSKHMIRLVFHWYTPKEKLFTKEGRISGRSMDVDNCLKIPTDCLFDAKYNDTWLAKKHNNKRESKLWEHLSKINNLNINDKFVFDTRSIKLPSLDGDFHCSIDVEVVTLFS